MYEAVRSYDSAARVPSSYVSFTVMGLLAWAVMQCIGEMLTIWPIPGALAEYVGAFVDDDLGIAVGIAYWCICALILVLDVSCGYKLTGPLIHQVHLFNQLCRSGCGRGRYT